MMQNAGVLYILTCKCAWRHSGVPFFDNFSTSALQKVARECQFFTILTWKCASRYSGVQFFHIATSKSGPNPSVFWHFDFEMCFSPQWRAIFPHRNFKKWSEPDMFCTFWLENVLLATAACNFCNIATSKSGPNLTCFVHFDLKMCFSLQRRAIFQHRNFKKRSEPDMFCTFWLENVLLATAACNFSCVLCRATSAPAALARLLFDPADTQNIEKHSISRLP